MNKKTWYLIAAILLVALVVVLVVLRPWNAGTGTENTETGTTVQETQETAGETNPVAAVGSDPAPETEAEPGAEESESAQLLEDEGDLIITIPEDEESDGF